MTLSITSLFTPAPSGVTSPQVYPPATGSWLSTLLSFGNTLGLSTTSWQSGGITSTILAIMASALAQGDQAVSTMAQGGFLSFASAVTPDPSIIPTATPGWLDLLALSEFDVTRTPALAATGSIAFTNSSGNTYGPYAPGTFHVQNPTSGQTYHNVNQFTIANLAVPQSFTFAADVAGLASTAAAGTITYLVTSAGNVTVTNATPLVGANAQSNASLVSACQAKFASRSPNGPGQAYYFFATSAATLIAALTAPGSTLPGAFATVPGTAITMSAITQAIVTVNKPTGVVTTTVANANGVVPGATNLTVIGATNATPIVIQTSAAHGLTTGQWAIVSGVIGNGAANVAALVTFVDTTHFSLQGTVGNGGYVSGGVVEGGDLGMCDYIIQANCVPDGVTAITQSATLQNPNVTVTVYVPNAYASTIAALVQTQLTEYFANSPIGGYTDPNGAYTNVIPIDAVIGQVFAAGIVGAAGTIVQNATVVIAGGSVNYPVGVTSVVEPASINVSVIPVGGVL
jgi:hypothetical protein